VFLKIKTTFYPGLVLILSFLVIALAADQRQPLHQDMAEKPEQPKVDYPEGPKGILTIHTDSSRNWFTLDKGLPITVVIKNTTRKDIKYAVANAFPIVDFVVVNSKDEKMPLTRYGKRVSSDTKMLTRFFLTTIKPGKQHKERLLLNQLFDMTEGGEYTIRASKIVRIGDQTRTLESNTLKLENDGFDGRLLPGEINMKESIYQLDMKFHNKSAFAQP